MKSQTIKLLLETDVTWLVVDLMPFRLHLSIFTDHTGLVTGVRFGKNASFVASVAMDRSLKYFGLQE